MSFDGKTLCGSLRDFAAAVDHQTGCVLSQLRVDAKTNEYKAAPKLPETLVLEGKVFTGDALLFCQKDLCGEILEQQADDFFQAEARTAARSSAATPPQNLAAFRNVTLNGLRRLGTDNFAAKIRSLTRNSRRLLTILGIVKQAMALFAGAGRLDGLSPTV